jgi:hypothetical protein
MAQHTSQEAQIANLPCDRQAFFPISPPHLGISSARDAKHRGGVERSPSRGGASRGAGVGERPGQPSQSLTAVPVRESGFACEITWQGRPLAAVAEGEIRLVLKLEDAEIFAFELAS